MGIKIIIFSSTMNSLLILLIFNVLYQVMTMLTKTEHVGAYKYEGVTTL